MKTPVFLTSLRARLERYFMAREYVRALNVLHVKELSETPVNQWALVKTRHAGEIQAAKRGQFDIIDRRTWAFPYIPEALHRLNQPVLKNCFSADSEILTKRGWVLIGTLKKGDWVISRLEDGSAKWVEVQDLISYQYKGPMYHFKGKFVDLLVSPDHRMYGRFRAFNRNKVWRGQTQCSICKRKFLSSQGLGSHIKKIHGIAGTYEQPRPYCERGPVGFAFAKDVAKWVGEHPHPYFAFEIPVKTAWQGSFPNDYDPVTGTIPLGRQKGVGRGSHWQGSETVRVNLKDFIAFLGIYVAEGSASGSYSGIDLNPRSRQPHYVQAIYAEADTMTPRIDRGFPSYETRISQIRTSPHFDEIQTLLSRLPWNFRREENDWSCFDRNLWKTLGGKNCYTKSVPTWVKELPPEYLRIFIEWAIKGDGCITGDGVWQYFTVSKQLADDMQEIFMKAGWEARIRTLRQSGSRKWKLDAKRQAPLYEVSRHQFEFKGIGWRNIEVVGYDGTIYCPAIPPYETVYVRRRQGIACWCGRTPYNL